MVESTGQPETIKGPIVRVGDGAIGWHELVTKHEPSLAHILAMTVGINLLVVTVCLTIATGEFHWIGGLVFGPLGSALVGWATMTR